MHFAFWIAFLSQIWACQNNTTQGTTPNTASATTQPETTAVVQPVVVQKLAPEKIDSNSKVVYLTFDDGPLLPTPTLYEIVTEKQIKMTTFVVGRHAKASKQNMQALQQTMQSPYFEVCNHSYSHAYSHYKAFYSNAASASKDIMDNETDLGLTTRIVRLPGRNIWATPNIKRGWGDKGGGGSTAKILLENGFKVYGWDMEWDRRGSDPVQNPQLFVSQVESLINRKATAVKNHIVILAHDDMLGNTNGRTWLREIIDLLRQKGYVFEHMSNYPL